MDHEEEIQKLKDELSELHHRISKGESDSSVFARQKQIQKIMDDHGHLAKLNDSVEETRSLLGADENFNIIVKEELENLTKQKEDLANELNEEIREVFEKKFPGVIMEIRAGVGGEEASLFAGDLYKMYSKYAAAKNWPISLVDASQTELGGYKEIIFEIKSSKAYPDLKYESGVHRIQRVPETEKSGRIHTSTATVAVFPKVTKKDVVINPSDIRIDVYRASGPGGQYVNKRDSAVRLLHIPTGIMVTSQKMRTQISNREYAMEILRSRLYDLEKQKEEIELSKERKEQMGTGMRSEKIRTYNVPQDRVTDHRVKKTWHNVNGIFNGEIDDMISELKKDLES